jgi:1A family penicillin-binding protein
VKWLAALLLVAILGLISAAVWVAWGLPRIDLSQPPGGRPLIVLEAADGTPISQSGGSYLGPVTREELPEHLVEAVLAIEDRRFYEHIGVDAFGIFRAAVRNISAGGIVQGGSTITQQLAKVLFLTPEQTMRRKLQEAAIATWLDTRLTKDEILTKYLDSVYFGAGATGISAAAKTYFNKVVRDLNVAESAMLAGLIRAPSKLNPVADLDASRERAGLVLQAMVDAGFITREEALPAALNPAAPVHSATITQTGSWFGDWVSANATSALGPLAGSARIRTTLQPAMQQAAEKVVGDMLARAGAEQGASEAALVAMTLDGAVVAMVGGRSYQGSQFNRAVDAMRQPGSAFKTFVYLAALKAGRTPDDTIADEPVEIGDWRPQNFDGKFHGEVTLQQAFARSLNAATVRLAQDVGIENVINTARELGIDAELPNNPSISLGTSEISLLDLTGAYASIAAGRTPVQPWGIAGISENPEAEPALFNRSLDGAQPVQGRDGILQMLASVVSEGTGRKAAVEGLPAAGKTGTSQESRDGWFIGFTDKLVTGVWVGNDDNSPTKDVTGGGLPTEIWRDFNLIASGRAPAGAEGKVGAEAAPAPRKREPAAEAEEEAAPVATRREAPAEAAPQAEAAAEPRPTRAQQRRARQNAERNAAAEQEAAAQEEAAPQSRAERRAARQRQQQERIAERRARAEQRAARRRAELEGRQAAPAEGAQRVRRSIQEQVPVIPRQGTQEQRVIRRQQQPAGEQRFILRRGDGNADGPSILLNGQRN